MGEAKYIFEKLTPITDSDISVYESAIDFVFENNDVKNIALSGAYGAGKSSVLASYKSSHPDTKFCIFLWHTFKTIKTMPVLMHLLKNQSLRAKFSIN